MNRRFGMEIEFVSSTSVKELLNQLNKKKIKTVFSDEDTKTAKHWKLVPDTSIEYYLTKNNSDFTDDIYELRGMELVSPPMNFGGLREVKKILNLLKSLGCRITDKCGLHVHVDSSDLTPFQKVLVQVKYEKFETEIDRFINSKRKTSSACGTLKGVSAIYAEKRVFNAFDEKHCKVSLQTAFDGRKTIEFRHHHGTLDHMEISNWVRFVVGFVEGCKDTKSLGLKMPELSKAEKGLWDAFLTGNLRHRLYAKTKILLNSFLDRVKGIATVFYMGINKWYIPEIFSTRIWRMGQLWYKVPSNVKKYYQNISSVTRVLHSYGVCWV